MLGHIGSVFEAATTTGAESHFLGNIVNRHAALKAFLQLLAVHVFADADDHDRIINENDS